MTRCMHCGTFIRLKPFLTEHKVWRGRGIFCFESERGLHEPLPDLTDIEAVDEWLRR